MRLFLLTCQKLRSMSEWKFFKIDIWWKAVFMLGVIACIGAAIFDINFIERKHFFGLGLGMILIGLGYWKAWKTFSQFQHGGILSWQDYKHDFLSIFLIIIGIVLIGIFGFFIIRALI